VPPRRRWRNRWTDKLEKKLQETPGIDKIRSYSKPGETLIFVQVNEATRGRDVADAWYHVRKKVGDIRGTLPPNVQGPFFNDEFGDVYGVMFAFATDGFNYRELKDYVEAVRQRLLKVPNVARWICSGYRTRRSTSRSRTAARTDRARHPAACRPDRRTECGRGLRCAGAADR